MSELNATTAGDARIAAQQSLARKAIAFAVALLAAVALWASNVPAAQAATFKDTPSNHWVNVQGFLDYAVSHDLMSGYKDPATQKLTGNFGPEDHISRGQVATVLFRIANPGKDTAGATTGFKDQGAFPYYRAAIKWLKDQGVVTGDKDQATQKPLNTFRPDDDITRQELATMVYRFAQKRGVKPGKVDTSVLNSFKDGAAVMPFAREAVAWSNKSGIITGGKGADAGKLMPLDQTTRAQAAKIFSVLHKDVLGLGESTKPEPEPEPEPNKPQQPSTPNQNVPAEYKAALERAQLYESQHFSKKGLYNQLSSQYGDHYSAAAAQYAVDNVKFDWKANALESAKTFNKFGYFSKQALTYLLTADPGSGFTADEAKYAIDNLKADYKANALASAQEYLVVNTYSKQALYDQLSLEGFTADEAKYAVDNVKADWKANALAVARSYSGKGYSKDLIRTWLTDADKFTKEEADYAIANL